MFAAEQQARHPQPMRARTPVGRKAPSGVCQIKSTLIRRFVLPPLGDRRITVTRPFRAGGVVADGSRGCALCALLLANFFCPSGTKLQLPICVDTNQRRLGILRQFPYLHSKHHHSQSLIVRFWDLGFPELNGASCIGLCLCTNYSFACNACAIDECLAR